MELSQLKLLKGETIICTNKISSTRSISIQFGSRPVIWIIIYYILLSLFLLYYNYYYDIYYYHHYYYYYYYIMKKKK